MNSSFKPEAGKSNNNNSSKAADPLVPSPDCARNPRTPVDYLRFLTQFPNLHADLALNPALPPDLEQWIKGHPDPRVQENLRAVNRPLPPVKSPVTSGVPSPAAPTQVFPYPPGNPQGYPQVPGSQVPGFSAMPNYPQGVPVPGSRVYQPLPGQYLKPRRKRRWLIPLIATVAALVIIGGGIGAYFAFAGFRHVGYSSPEELAKGIEKAVSKTDVIGLAQMSAPSEDVLVEDSMQLNKELKKYISTAKSDSNGGSGQLVDKVSELTDVSQHLELDTSGLDRDVKTLSDDMARIIYAGNIGVKVKDREKLKESLDKLVYNNKNTSKKEDRLNRVLEGFDRLEKDGIEIDSRNPLKVMAVKEEGKWYYSVSASIAENQLVRNPSDAEYYNYRANWGDPGATPSDATQFSKELSEALSKVKSGQDLISDGCMRFLDMPERRLVMVYGSSSYIFQPSNYGYKADINYDIKADLSPGDTNSYGVSFKLDSLRIKAKSYLELDAELKGTNYSHKTGSGKFSIDFGKYLKQNLQLVAKKTSQGLKLSLSGTVANLLNNLDYDQGYKYFEEYTRHYGPLQRDIEENLPFLTPYKKVIFGYFGLLNKIDREADWESYSDDSDYDDSDYDYDD